jgi:hypothetical protein
MLYVQMVGKREMDIERIWNKHYQGLNVQQQRIHQRKIKELYGIHFAVSTRIKSQAVEHNT